MITALTKVDNLDKSNLTTTIIMTIVNTVAAKLVVAFVAVAMIFTMAMPAQAQTAEEMQAMINDLLAEIAALQSGMGSGDSMMSGSCALPSTRDLTIGATGSDVMALQQWLMAEGYSIPAGPTDYFGGQTQAALAAWQAANGVSPAAGYYGPVTRGAIEAWCASQAPMTDNGGSSDEGDAGEDEGEEEEEEEEEDDELRGGEADIEDIDASDEEDEVNEGEVDVEVLNVEFDVEDGDVRLERVEVTLDNSAIGVDGEDEPWDAFEEISIFVDGDKVASEDVTEEDDWDDTNENVGEYSFRLTNVDTVFREDTTGEIIIAVSAQNGVDVDGDAGEDDWEIFIDVDGLRFIDGEGLDIEGPNAESDRSTFEIQEEGDDDDLKLESATEDPDDETYEVDEDDEKEHLIFAFDLSAEDSEADISIDSLFIDVTVGSADTDYDTVDELVDDFRIEIGGDSYDAESYNGGTATVNGIEFEVDLKTTIAEDTEETVFVYAIFNDVESTFTTATITASIDASTADIDAEGDDDLRTIDGSDQDGDIHTLRLEGINLGDVTDGDDSNDAEHEKNTDTPDNSFGTFFLTYEIEAFGDDLFIPANSVARSATASSTVGVTFTMENAQTGATVSNGTTSVTYDIDGAEEDNGFYELKEGTQYEMTVSVDSFNPVAAGTFQFQLISVGFNDTENTPDTTEAPGELNDYESDSVQIDS